MARVAIRWHDAGMIRPALLAVVLLLAASPALAGGFPRSNLSVENAGPSAAPPAEPPADPWQVWWPYVAGGAALLLALGVWVRRRR